MPVNPAAMFTPVRTWANFVKKKKLYQHLSSKIKMLILNSLSTLIETMTRIIVL